jgi:hypothetical protein
MGLGGAGDGGPFADGSQGGGFAMTSYRVVTRDTSNGWGVQVGRWLAGWLAGWSVG